MIWVLLKNIKLTFLVLLKGIFPVRREPPLGCDVLHDGGPGHGLGVRLVGRPDLVSGALHCVWHSHRFLAPTGAQGVTIFVRSFVCLVQSSSQSSSFKVREQSAIRALREQSEPIRTSSCYSCQIIILTWPDSEELRLSMVWCLASMMRGLASPSWGHSDCSESSSLSDSFLDFRDSLWSC